MCVCRLSLQNTGVVSLEYDWHIEMIDRQTAMDFIRAGPAAVIPPTAGSLPSGASPPQTVTSPSSRITPSHTLTSPPSVISPPTMTSPPSAVPPTPASGKVSSAGKASIDFVPGKKGGSSAMVVGSSSQPSDSLYRGGSSQVTGTAASGTPEFIDGSPSPTQQAKVTAALTSLLTGPHATSDKDAAAYVSFTVSPASGEIAAGATAEILVKFSPLDVMEYFACLYARYRRHVIHIYAIY